MRVKRRIFAGVVCEQEVYTASGRGTDGPGRLRKPRPRFASEEERERHREEISRRRHARMVNANFGPAGYYSTLTLDDAHEVHTFAEAKRLRDNYLRRLRRACPGAKVAIYCGRGKGTARIHYHMLSMGVPEEVIRSRWGLGEIVRIVHLRAHCYYNGVDHGADYTGLANYLFGHWTPEQGGHRWAQTRNMDPPQRDELRAVKTDYRPGRPPAAPVGYILVEQRSTPYGYCYFKYVQDPRRQADMQGRGRPRGPGRKKEGQRG